MGKKPFCELAPDRVHRSCRLNEPGGIDFVPFLFGENARTNGRNQFIVVSLLTQESANIGLFQAEQTVAEFAVGGQANPITAQTKGLTDGCDQANSSDAIGKDEFGRGPAMSLGGLGGNGNQRHD